MSRLEAGEQADVAARALAPGPAAHQGLDPGQQLARRDRLDHIVVGPQLQPDDAVDRIAQGAEQQDGRAVGPRHLAAQRQAVLAGQVDVQHHHVDQAALQHLAGGGHGVGLAHGVALGVQIAGHFAPQRLVVLDQQDGGGFGEGVQGHGVRIQPDYGRAWTFASADPRRDRSTGRPFRTSCLQWPDARFTRISRSPQRGAKC
jgi:hypothetical protein